MDAKAKALEIMQSLSDRSGIDLFQYDQEICDEIQEDIANIIEKDKT